jgi:hypothetical protein
MKAQGRRPPADSEYRLWLIVWIALTCAILGYFALGLWVTPIATADNPTLERILMTLSAAYVIASYPAKRWLLVQAEEVDSAVLRRTAIVVPMVLCEVAGVTGIALRLVIAAPHYYVFLGLALAGMLLNFPRRAK